MSEDSTKDPAIPPATMVQGDQAHPPKTPEPGAQPVQAGPGGSGDAPAERAADADAKKPAAPTPAAKAKAAGKTEEAAAARSRALLADGSGLPPADLLELARAGGVIVPMTASGPVEELTPIETSGGQWELKDGGVQFTGTFKLSNNAERVSGIALEMFGLAKDAKSKPVSVCAVVGGFNIAPGKAVEFGPNSIVFR